MRIPPFGLQVTGKFQFDPRVLETAAQCRAGARAMLVQASAKQSGLSYKTARYPGTNKRYLYRTAFTPSDHRDASFPMARWLCASSQTAPKDLQLKDPKDFTLIGTRSSAATRR